jgi:hypothetical protein
LSGPDFKRLLKGANCFTTMNIPLFMRPKLLVLVIISQDSSLSIPMGCGLISWSLIPTAARDFSSLHSVQIGSGDHRAFNSMVISGSFSRSKVERREGDHPPPPSSMTKSCGTIPPLSYMSSLCVAYKYNFIGPCLTELCYSVSS